MITQRQMGPLLLGFALLVYGLSLIPCILWGQVAWAASPVVSAEDPSTPSVQLENDDTRQLKMRILEIQNKGKLALGKVVPCTSVDGFGVYSPVARGQQLSQMVIYLEPSNVSTLVSADRYVIDCSVDLCVSDLSGKLLAEKKGVSNLNVVARSPVMDLYFKIPLTVSKPLKQGIIIRLTLRDKIKNQAASASIKLEPQREKGTAPGNI